MDELPGVQTGLFLQPASPDVLGQNRRDAGDLGRSHGGAGVVGIALAAVGNAVQRIDIAAGSGDLRLQLQGTGNAPTGEVAHGLALVSSESVVDLVGDGQLAQVVQHVSSLVGDRLGAGLHIFALCQGDADAGSLDLVAVKGQVDGSGLVVENNGAHSSGVHGVGGLLRKGQLASGTHGDAAFQGIAQGGVILHGAVARQNHILIGTAQAGYGRVSVVGALGVENLLVAHGKEVAGVADVVCRGHGKGVGVGAGSACGVHTHFVGIEVA